MYAFVVSTRYTASGQDYTHFLAAVGTPSLLDATASAAAVTATTFNGIDGFYVPVVAGSCVKFDASLGLVDTTAGPVDDLGIRVSELGL